MKNTLMNPRAFAIALAVFFTISIATPAMATDEKKTFPAELIFVGNIKNQPVFQLIFSNTEDNEFTIVVRDQNNTVLYKDNVKGSYISRKFMLDTEDLGDATVQFEITDKKTEKQVIYEINKTSRFVDNVVINKKN